MKLEHPVLRLAIEERAELTRTICYEVAVLEKVSAPTDIQLTEHTRLQQADFVTLVRQQVESSGQCRARVKPGGIVLELNHVDATRVDIALCATEHVQLVSLGVDFQYVNVLDLA